MLHILLVSAFAVLAAAECKRETLSAAADKYVASITGGKILLPIIENVTYFENFKPASIQTGVLSKGIKISLQRHLLDTTTCSTFTEIIAHENNPAYIIASQIHYSDGIANKIDSIVTTKENGWLFDAEVTYSFASKEKRPIIPEAERDSRRVIQAVADAHLDKFSDGKIEVPMHSRCERLEGALLIAPNCAVLAPSKEPKKMTNRRYVIDEAFGTVDVFLNFDSNMPDSHEFRVERGKLRYVHIFAISHLAGKGKGNAPKIP